MADTAAADPVSHESTRVSCVLAFVPQTTLDPRLMKEWIPNVNYGQQAFSIECTSLGNLERAAQNLKFEALGDKAKTQAALDAAEKDGTRVKPEFGSVWYHIQGADKDHGRPHMTVAVPGCQERGK